MKKKTEILDMDGDLIPEDIYEKGLAESRTREGHFLCKENGVVVAIKCPAKKAWCKGMGAKDAELTCIGCELYNVWQSYGIHKMVKPSTDFVKNDSGKLEWSLMPFKQLEDVVRVLMFGAEKYSRDNWKKCDDVNRYKDALMRHVTAYIEGEKFDKGNDGDNLHHLAHAICNCLFLLWFDQKETDEWKKFLEIKQKK